MLAAGEQQDGARRCHQRRQNAQKLRLQRRCAGRHDAQRPRPAARETGKAPYPPSFYQGLAGCRSRGCRYPGTPAGASTPAHNCLPHSTAAGWWASSPNTGQADAALPRRSPARSDRRMYRTWACARRHRPRASAPSAAPALQSGNERRPAPETTCSVCSIGKTDSRRSVSAELESHPWKACREPVVLKGRDRGRVATWLLGRSVFRRSVSQVLTPKTTGFNTEKNC